MRSPEQKLKLLESLEHQSKREAEKKLASIQPKVIKQESEKVLTESLTEIRFVADESLLKKLNRIREITAHQSMSSGESTGIANIFHKLAEEYLERHDPLIKAKRLLNKVSTSPETKPCVTKAPMKIESRHIPASIRHKIWMRDQGKCTFEKNGRKCNSSYGVEIDHIQPYGIGGAHTMNNLRLLCRQHNQLQSKKAYG